MVGNNTIKRTPLLPDRHPIQDFFICDVTDAIPKDDMGSMEHPIYSLATQPDLAVREYEHNGVKVAIIPSTLGLATIHDKDILIYCISQLVAKMNAGHEPHRTLHIKAYDLLVSTNRNNDGRAYQQLVAALDRLKGTTIRTNIKTGGEENTSGFGLIDSWNILRHTESGRMSEIRINLSDWVFNAVLEPRGAHPAPRLFPAQEAAGTPHVRAGPQALRQAGRMGDLARSASQEMRLRIQRKGIPPTGQRHLRRGRRAQPYARLCGHVEGDQVRFTNRSTMKPLPSPRNSRSSPARPGNLP